jgi:hypothetical protein
MNEHRNPTHSRRALLLLLAAASASIGVLVAKRATEAQQTPVPHPDEKSPSGASARLYGASEWWVLTAEGTQGNPGCAHRHPGDPRRSLSGVSPSALLACNPSPLSYQSRASADARLAPVREAVGRSVVVTRAPQSPFGTG